jgi:quinol monooxygenase YgiN
MKYSVNGKISALEGNGEALKNILLEAANEMEQVQGCHLYIVGMDHEDKDSVYVYEVWESAEAHKASLSLPVFQKLITSARPIIKEMTSYPELKIYGGKGL